MNKKEMQQRAFFWDILLGTYSPSLPHPTILEIENQKLNLPEQRTIRMDIPRTRPQILSKASQPILEKIITRFCSSERISYKQGINEIFGVVAVFNECGLAWEKVYEYGRKIVLDYNFFKDEEFMPLQLAFRWISLLLKYHDYTLFDHINNQNCLTPELYATSWILTLFANRMSLDCVYLFWETLFASKDWLMLFFFIAAVLISHRQKLLSTESALLPQTITGIFIDNVEDLKRFVKKAVDLRANTPQTACMPERIFDLPKKQLLDLQYQLEMAQNLGVSEKEASRLVQRVACYCRQTGCTHCRKPFVPQEIRGYVQQNHNLDELLNYHASFQKGCVIVEPNKLDPKSDKIQIVKLNDQLSEYEIQLSYVCILKNPLSAYIQPEDSIISNLSCISELNAQIIVPFKTQLLNRIPVQQPPKGLMDDQFESVYSHSGSLQQENIRQNFYSPKRVAEIEPIILPKDSRLAQQGKDPVQRYNFKGIFSKFEVPVSALIGAKPSFQIHKCRVQDKSKAKILFLCQDFICLLEHNLRIEQHLERITGLLKQSNKSEKTEPGVIISHYYYMVFLKKISSKRTNGKIISFYFKQPIINTVKTQENAFFEIFKCFNPEISKDNILESQRLAKSEFKLSLEFGTIQEALSCVDTGKQYYRTAQMAP